MRLVRPIDRLAAPATSTAPPIEVRPAAYPTWGLEQWPPARRQVFGTHDASARGLTRDFRFFPLSRTVKDRFSTLCPLGLPIGMHKMLIGRIRIEFLQELLNRLSLLGLGGDRPQRERRLRWKQRRGAIVLIFLITLVWPTVPTRDVSVRAAGLSETSRPRRQCFYNLTPVLQTAC